MLPYLAGSAAKREMQREFRGLNRRAGAAENEFAAMENMTGSQYPLLAPRNPRGKARKLKKESSSVGLAGIVKKLGYWIIIATAFLTAYALTALGKDILNIDLSFLALLGWFTLACLLINEVRSILENLVEYGLDVPYVLIKGLAVTERLLNDTTDNMLGTDEQKSEE